MAEPDARFSPWVVKDVDDASVSRIEKELHVSALVARLMAARGIREPEDAKRFLHPSFERDWRDPSVLAGMGAAAARVAAAVRAAERIVVFGDFDADGLTASAVLASSLTKAGADVEVVIPHRFREGYGLTPASVERVLELAPDLVITVDCGIGSAAEVDALRAAGVDVVVTDHHEPADDVPRGVPVVDPKADPEYPFPGLAGAGVALKLAQAVCEDLGRPGEAEGLLDVAALGTVADMVPLLDENRTLVREGLERMRAEPRPGIRALTEAAGLRCEDLDSAAIAFALAPRLNAAGRMADPEPALRLLMTDDEDEAAGLARHLGELNALRQQAERDLFRQAQVGAEEQVRSGAPVVVLAGEDWHQGVRGIVASRIVRRFGVPAIVFTVEADLASGSGRSVPGLDLHSCLCEVAELTVGFGGHAMAAGVKVEKGRLEEFTAALREVVARAAPVAVPRMVDAELALGAVSLELAEEIRLLEPFGEGNPRPLFGARGVFMDGRRRVGKRDEHLLFEAFDGFASVPAVAFRLPAVEELAERQDPVDIVFEVERDDFRGRQRVRLLVRDIVTAPDGDERHAAALVEDLFEAAPAILSRGEYAGVGDADSFHTKLVGVTFEGRQDVVSSLEPGTPLRLERQPDNPHDPNACALFAPDGRQAGFFNRRLAAALAPLIDDGLELDVTVTDVTGGEEGKPFGVNVLVSQRGEEGEAATDDSEETRQRLQTLPPDELDTELARRFIGDSELRPAQAQALKELAAGRSTLVVMATGRGKSLIFHMHAAKKALRDREASVFVYPLRALVSDQALSLEANLGGLGIGCEVLTGETPLAKRDEVFERIAQGRTQVVLTTPEFLERHAGRFAQTGRVGFLVFDEAHHVGRARAGHRPAYQRMGEVREALGAPLTLAVTATADDSTADGVIRSLGLETVVTDPAVRHNLRIEDARGAKDKVAYVASVAARGEKVVVYVNSRDKSVAVAQQVRKKVPALRHACIFYNGGLGRAQRRMVEDAFRSGEVTLVVATSAFGEGVDIPDIRHVVHFHMPFGQVEFNQMSGRAGRDGLDATVHLLFGERDAKLNELILEAMAPPRDDLAALYLVLRDLTPDDEGFVEVTNAEIAEAVAKKRKGSRMSERGASCGLGVFRELGLVESEGSGAYRRLRLLQAPDGGVELEDSTRYLEGRREMDSFAEFREWALAADPSELLEGFNRPILPTRYASQRTGAK